MANQSHSGIHGDPWIYCQRCGTLQRASALKPQLGLLVCATNDCIDNLLVQQRPSYIEQVLATGPDAPPADILKRPSFENVDDYVI